MAIRFEQIELSVCLNHQSPTNSSVEMAKYIEEKNRQETSINWTRRDFSNRLANAFAANEWKSDMTFFVPAENQSIPAHSLLVAAASPMLERCCVDYDGSVTVGAIITIPDHCSATNCRIVLRYIYSGDIRELNDKNAAEILAIADYLDLSDLSTECVKTLDRALNVKNVCEIYNEMQLLSVVDLNDNCAKLIKDNMLEVLKDGSLMEMCDEAVRTMLQSDQPRNYYEMELVLSLKKWSDSECSFRSIPASGENRRLVCKNRFSAIRFATMSKDSFDECVRLFGANFFKDEELSLIYHQIRVNYAPRQYTAEVEVRERVKATLSECLVVVDVRHLNGPIVLNGVKLLSGCRDDVTIIDFNEKEIVEPSNPDDNDSNVINFKKGIKPKKGMFMFKVSHKRDEPVGTFYCKPIETEPNVPAITSDRDPHIVGVITCVTALHYSMCPIYNKEKTTL